MYIFTHGCAPWSYTSYQSFSLVQDARRGGIKISRSFGPCRVISNISVRHQKGGGRKPSRVWTTASTLFTQLPNWAGHVVRHSTQNSWAAGKAPSGETDVGNNEERDRYAYKGARVFKLQDALHHQGLRRKPAIGKKNNGTHGSAHS